MTLPNFLLVGAAKAGTSSLVSALRNHPDVFVPRPSEPKFLTADVLSFPHQGPGDAAIDAEVVRDLDAYRGLFADAGDARAVGEKSADLLFYHREVIPRVQELLGDPAILIILRNPVDRAFSAYNFLVGLRRETLSFDEALAAEADRLAQNWEFIWAYRAASLYSEAVAAYQKAFSRVHVVLFDDLKRDPEAVLRETFDFLGVAPQAAERVDAGRVHNASRAPRSQRVAAWRAGQGAVGRALALGRRLVPGALRDRVRQAADAWNGKPPRLTPGQRRRLGADFAADIARLELLIGRDLGAWRAS